MCLIWISFHLSFRSDDNKCSESSKNPSPLQIPGQTSRYLKQYGETGTPYLTPTGSVTGVCIVQDMLYIEHMRILSSVWSMSGHLHIIIYIYIRYETI